MRCAARPCGQCPWSRETPPGQFSPERYAALRGTTGDAGAEAWIDAPLFACHKSPDGEEFPCAGWLAAVGLDTSLRVRMLAARGEIPRELLRPGPDWPPLFSSYAEMMEAQAG